jgi:predicted ABC-type transport system involved in lysophospholipase L1 biosynthesis ATPase subunit
MVYPSIDNQAFHTEGQVKAIIAATGEKVMELMFDLNREQGTTLVLVTHDRAIAQRCDRRITIEAGRLL